MLDSAAPRGGTVRPRARLLLGALGVAGLLTILAVSATCSGGPLPADAGMADADAGVSHDASRSNDGDAVAPICDPWWWDGGILSDWPGWRRLTELSPCCTIDVAQDASASLPALNWIPCSNTAANCVEIDRTWPVDHPVSYFGNGPVSHDASGAPLLLPLGFSLSGTLAMVGIYSLPSLVPVAAVQADTGYTTNDPSAHCPLNEMAAGPGLALLSRAGSGGPMVAAQGLPTVVTSTPSFATLAPPGAIPGFQNSLASATRLAFDVQPYGLIEQWPFDAGSLVQSTNTTGAALLLHFVEGDDVYARSVYGTQGWTQEYLVKPDGSVVLYRSKPQRQIGGMATDGKTIAWCEGYGTSAPSEQQPIVEVWAAPYTNDPAVLDATAKKVATIPQGVWCSDDAVAFDGYYAVTATSTFFTATVIRLSDGAMQQVPSGPGWGFGLLALITPTELWSRINDAGADASLGMRGTHFARYTLAPWP